MKTFDRSDEATEPLAAFTKKIWNALVPRDGACLSVQGELVRVSERLWAEAVSEGMGNYYEAVSSFEQLARSHYGAMAFFLLDTLVANRGGALDADDVAYFARARAAIEADWRSRTRIIAIENGEGDLSPAETAELAQLEASPDRIAWQEVLTRAERCVANYCVKNPELVDRDGKSVAESGVRSIAHVFAPPPAAPPCPKCNGKGWLAPSSPSDFPTACSCTTR